MYRVMIIEDDEKIRKIIGSHLEKYGYSVAEAIDYSNIKGEFIREKPDVVFMDINLPKYDGFYWCREIRAISKVPVIFISARSSDMDQVMAIENGGDDYIIKPFSIEVLSAKLKGVIRRAYGEYSTADDSGILEIDGLILNKNKNSLEYSGKSIELSKREFSLICCLMKKTGCIVSREELLEALWDDTEFVDDNTLSVNVTRARKRLEDVGIYNAIETKRGLGYCLNNTWKLEK